MILISIDGKIKHVTNNEAREIYLDYLNNYLTIAAISEAYNITYYSMHSLINKMRGA